jgi:hypothetical protein
MHSISSHRSPPVRAARLRYLVRGRAHTVDRRISSSCARAHSLFFYGTSPVLPFTKPVRVCTCDSPSRCYSRIRCISRYRAATAVLTPDSESPRAHPPSTPLDGDFFHAYSTSLPKMHRRISGLRSRIPALPRTHRRPYRRSPLLRRRVSLAIASPRHRRSHNTFLQHRIHTPRRNSEERQARMYFFSLHPFRPPLPFSISLVHFVHNCGLVLRMSIFPLFSLSSLFVSPSSFPLHSMLVAHSASICGLPRPIDPPSSLTREHPLHHHIRNSNLFNRL